MKINSRVIDGVGIVYVSGNIVLEETNQLKAYMEPLTGKPDIKGLIVNCKKIDYIDSSGLGLIVSIYKKLKELNKFFALTSLNSKTMEIFVLTRLHETLIIADTDDSAMASFKIRDTSKSE